MVKRVLLVLGLAVLVVSCGSQAAQKTSPPETADSIFAQLNRAIVGDQADVSLGLAKKLAAQFPGTSEADSASKLLPSLQKAVDKAHEAERRRAAKAAAEAKARRLAAKWSYLVDTDPMTSHITRRAMIESENSVNFAFPYDGSQHATLILRSHPSYGRDVILRIVKGQLQCPSYEGCRVRVRFDAGAPQTWEAVGPSDNSTTTVFIRGYPLFLRRLRAAKVIRIQVSVYQEGAPVFEFQVGGFNYARYTGR